jgi:subtilase family serine protease
MKPIFLLGFIAVVLAASAQKRTDAINAHLRDLWVVGNKVPSNEIHSVVIAVKQKEGAEQQCGNLLEKLADPSSPYYGQYLSVKELRNVFTDRLHTLTVERYLRNHRIPYTVNTVGDFITVKTTIKDLEKLFDADFWYHHSTLDSRVVKRTETYTIPAEVNYTCSETTMTIFF